ncbi:hypothetical protein [Streptomyces spiralis]|uniref:hypothetical protein n=1 Tax=Streptomyces spiralis TaxID=66376 RepID=UPI001671A168|nr:hypothetical protein [Streptomyces spiralis]
MGHHQRTRATAEKTASDLTTSHVGRHLIQPDADGHYRIGGLWPWEEWPTEENDTDGSPATTASSDVPWQNLADALNALVDAGQFPHFHDLYGARNDWQHQPCANAGAHGDTPWVVFDLATRQFTVSSRERALSGDHFRQPRPPRG